MASLVEIFHREHTDVVAENFKTFLENETYIDLIFVCSNNRKVGAHQIVMGCLSKFLSSLLIQNQNDTKEKVIYIYVPDIRAKIMKHILQFVYTGKTMVNREDLGEFNDDLILLGSPLSALTSVDRGHSSNAPGTIPNPMTPSTQTPIGPVPIYQSNELIPNMNINVPTSSCSNPGFAISNVESLHNSTFSPSNAPYSNMMNPSRFINQPNQMPPMNTAPPNIPVTGPGTPCTQSSTFGPRFSAEVITSSIPKPTSAPVSTSKTPNQKSAVKSETEPKPEKRRITGSGGGARKSLKFDQCIDLIESDDDSDIISIT